MNKSDMPIHIQIAFLYREIDELDVIIYDMEQSNCGYAPSTSRYKYFCKLSRKLKAELHSLEFPKP